MRSRQILHLKKTQSPNPYPHKFHVTRSITSYIDAYGAPDKVPPGTRLDGIIESLAGRVHNIRASGSKLIFYDLHGEGNKVQIMATQQCVVQITTLSPPLAHVYIPLYPQRRGRPKLIPSHS